MNGLNVSAKKDTFVMNKKKLMRFMMIIREYRPADCPLLAQLFYDTVHTVNAKDYAEDQLDAWATGDVDLEEWNRSFLTHTALVAVWDGVVAVVAGFADMDRNGYLDRLFVHKDYQGKGLATALVKELERRAIDKNVVSFETYTSITAKPFFEKLGYSVQAENITIRGDISLSNFQMTKVYRKATRLWNCKQSD
ncbi:GNAT family N-acetyltransferase [Pectinatus frisingensis]|uniref:GNAT family N-acetyltransferase n=1 Tax=Pectinatus frisingensis TaxID=865 RepID=UPI0018C6C69C